MTQADINGGRCRTYNFPGSTIRVYPDKTCREFPKWCLQIDVERPRQYVAKALHELRAWRRQALAS